MGYHGQTWDVNTFLNKKMLIQMFPLDATVPPHVVYNRTLSPIEPTIVLILFYLNRRHRGTRARPAETVGRRNRSVTKQLHFRISSASVPVQVQNLVTGIICQTVYKPGSVSPVWRTVRARMAIHLGRPSPDASRDRPERRRERLARRSRQKPRPPAAPTWSCSRWGLPCRRRCRRRGALLPHHFTLAAHAVPPGRAGGGARRCVSVALSLGSPPPGVTRHRASVEPGLSSPGQERTPGRARPSDRLARDQMGSEH